MKSNWQVIENGGRYYVQDLRRYFRKSETTGVIRRRNNGRIKRVKGLSYELHC